MLCSSLIHKSRDIIKQPHIQFPIGSSRFTMENPTQELGLLKKVNPKG